jgi:hypothetical protein
MLIIDTRKWCLHFIPVETGEEGGEESREGRREETGGTTS